MTLDFAYKHANQPMRKETSNVEESFDIDLSQMNEEIFEIILDFYENEDSAGFRDKIKVFREYLNSGEVEMVHSYGLERIKCLMLRICRPKSNFSSNFGALSALDALIFGVSDISPILCESDLLDVLKLSFSMSTNDIDHILTLVYNILRNLLIDVPSFAQKVFLSGLVPLICEDTSETVRESVIIDDDASLLKVKAAFRVLELLYNDRAVFSVGTLDTVTEVILEILRNNCNLFFPCVFRFLAGLGDNGEAIHYLHDRDVLNEAASIVQLEDIDLSTLTEGYDFLRLIISNKGEISREVSKSIEAVYIFNALYIRLSEYSRNEDKPFIAALDLLTKKVIVDNEYEQYDWDSYIDFECLSDLANIISTDAMHTVKSSMSRFFLVFCLYSDLSDNTRIIESPMFKYIMETSSSLEESSVQALLEYLERVLSRVGKSFINESLLNEYLLPCLNELKDAYPSARDLLDTYLC